MSSLLSIDDLYINICILGPTSAGKSTLLNALFVKQYSDMKIKRTTAVPQIYHEHYVAKQENNELKNSRKNIKTQMALNIFFGDIMKKNREINEAFMQKTQKGKDNEIKYEDIEELKYYVPPVMDLVKLHNNISLKIFDTPGLDDSKVKDIYYKYLQNNFHKMDVAITMFDINSSLNTAGEVEILESVINNIKNNYEKYNINVELIILINKCDDMILKKEKIEFENEEHADLFQQANDIINATVKKIYSELKYSVLSISCEDAFIYRMFKADNKVQLDAKQLNKFGINEYGKAKWNKLSDDEKKNKIIELLNHCDHNERMIMCGFDAFRQKLINIFSVNKQYEFIVHHIKYLLYSIKKSDNVDITQQLEEINLLKHKLDQVSKLFNCSENSEIKLSYMSYLKEFDDFISKYILEYNEKYANPIITKDVDEKTFSSSIIIQTIFKKICLCFQNTSNIIKKSIIDNVSGLNKYYINKLNDLTINVDDIFVIIDNLIVNKYDKINNIMLNVFSKILQYNTIPKTPEKILFFIKKIKEKYYKKNKEELLKICICILDDYYLNIFEELCGVIEFKSNTPIFRRDGTSLLQHLVEKLYTRQIINECDYDIKCITALKNIYYFTKVLHMWNDIEEYEDYSVLYIKNRLSWYNNHINSNIINSIAKNIRPLLFNISYIDFELEKYIISLI